MERLITRPPDTYRVPQTEAEKIIDPYWRLQNLYTVKDKDTSQITRFRMNDVQEDLFWRMHKRNSILKSRQHGITTKLNLFGLDRVNFTSNFKAHFIQQDKEVAKKTFDEKVHEPYQRMTEEFPELAKPFKIETEKKNVYTLKLKNGSLISTGTTGRGETIDLLHISEHGPICAASASQAKEVRTGAMPAVHEGGLVFSESTAVNRMGDFYTLCVMARSLAATAGLKLTWKDFKLFFYPWYIDRLAVLAPDAVTLSDDDKQYFKELWEQEKIRLTPGQKAWYVKTKELQREDMFTEYPSTFDEAFVGKIEGKTYAKLLIKLRENGNISPQLPYQPGVQVNTCWDLGKDDYTAIWTHQYIAYTGTHRFLHYMEGQHEGYEYYWNWLLELRDRYGFVLGEHYLPHDVKVSEQSMRRGETRADALRQLGMRNLKILDRIPNLIDGINATRQLLAISEFSEAGCDKGLARLQEYEAFPKDDQGRIKQSASQHEDSNAADAIRQAGQYWFQSRAYRRTKKQGKRRDNNPMTA